MSSGIKRSNPPSRLRRLKYSYASKMSQGTAERKLAALTRNTRTFSERFWYMNKKVDGRSFFHITPSSRYTVYPLTEKEIRWYRNKRWWWNGLYKVGKGGLNRKYEARGRFLPKKQKYRTVRWKHIVVNPRSMYKVNKTVRQL